MRGSAYGGDLGHAARMRIGWGAIVRAMTVMIRPHRKMCFSNVSDNYKSSVNFLEKIPSKKADFWFNGFWAWARFARSIRKICGA
jgi:hypothetical protein